MPIKNWNESAVQTHLTKAHKRLIALGLLMESAIKQSMRPGTGIMYRKHRASVPGAPPAPDTGRLRASITTNWTLSGMARTATSGKKGQEGDGVGQPSATKGKFTVVVGTNVEYACLKSNTIILTKEGWKRISFIKIGDEVLTQTGNYHKVLNIIKVKNIDHPDMVTIEINYRKGMSRKLSMTKEHKILVYRNGRNKWICAGELLKTDCVYATPKIAHNKGISKYKIVYCKNCAKIIKGHENDKGKRIFCSVECRVEFWNKGNNPHNGAKRTEEVKNKMSISAVKRIKEHPENHANYIMGKKGFKTFPEKQVCFWLEEQGLKEKYIQQYPVGGKFVDFYIPELNQIIEADGAYWHRNQEKDIKRDLNILKHMPFGTEIYHIHFFDERFSPKNMDLNPIHNVYYSPCNPGTDSFVNLSCFRPFQIKSIKHWKYEVKPKGKQKGIRTTYLYDLSIDKVHSYYANGVLVSNSWLEFGTRRMQARPFIRPQFDKLKRKF
jgi:hypothetical protein